MRLFSVISEHTLEKSYPCAEMQSVYFVAPANWPTHANEVLNKARD